MNQWALKKCATVSFYFFIHIKSAHIRITLSVFFFSSVIGGVKFVIFGVNKCASREIINYL